MLLYYLVWMNEWMNEYVDAFQYPGGWCNCVNVQILNHIHFPELHIISTPLLLILFKHRDLYLFHKWKFFPSSDVIGSLVSICKRYLALLLFKHTQASVPILLQKSTYHFVSSHLNLSHNLSAKSKVSGCWQNIGNWPVLACLKKQSRKSCWKCTPQ